MLDNHALLLVDDALSSPARIPIEPDQAIKLCAKTEKNLMEG